MNCSIVSFVPEKAKGTVMAVPEVAWTFEEQHVSCAMVRKDSFVMFVLALESWIEYDAAELMIKMIG